MRAVLLAALLLGALPALAQRPAADARCTGIGEDFVYDCVIRLSRGGKPLAGARVTVSADMPSMPGAHAIVPVAAAPGARAGDYSARLDLDMPGLWALRLRLAGPVNDELLLHLEFDEKKSSPPKRAARERK